MYLDHGSDVENVCEYVVALFNVVAIIYQNEGILINISEILIWETLDPYNALGSNSVGDWLNLFEELRQNNFNGDLAHLLTTQLGGGKAYIDQLCKQYQPTSCCAISYKCPVQEVPAPQYNPCNLGPYGITGGLGTAAPNPFPIYSRDVKVVAHELGHNFGSRHTHALVWGPNNNLAIDCCAGFVEPAIVGCPVFLDCCENYEIFLDPATSTNQGTIMSYCDGPNDPGVDFSKGFGHYPGELIRSKYIAASEACLGGVYLFP